VLDVARLVPLLTAVALMGLAPSAGAATLITDKPCYVESAPVAFAGSGYTPGGSANVLLDGVFQGSTPVDGSGVIGNLVGAPATGSAKQRNFTLTAADSANPANQATVTRIVTELDVKIKPKGGSPSRKRRITARGFPQKKNLYAHVRRKGKGRNVKIGKVKGPCGKLKKKKRLFPRKSKTGTYTVQFDTKRKYRKKTVPRVTFKVFIFRRVRSSAAASSGERWVRID
jgi:hypothetical protein